MKNQFLALFLLFISCDRQTKNEDKTKVGHIPSAIISYVNEYPHDINAFTEGFFFHNGILYESTGASSELPQTRSLFGEVNLESGMIDVKVELDRDNYFGEGVTFLNGKFYQLTYQARTGFEYDSKTFEKTREFRLPSKEGWGLTNDGESLIMSDGTSQLTYFDPVSFNIIRQISVKENQNQVDMINELEFVDGYIFANIWLTNEIVKINAANGNVVGRIDLSFYANNAKNTFANSMEMNGIAYNPERDSFFFTGKLWPKIFEVKIAM